jgi:hypothetical protein
MDVEPSDACVEFAQNNPQLAENKTMHLYHLNEQELTVMKDWRAGVINNCVDAVIRLATS